MFSHHETNNISEIRCVATIFWRSVHMVIQLQPKNKLPGVYPVEHVRIVKTKKVLILIYDCKNTSVMH
jgi:hypothetical protein